MANIKSQIKRNRQNEARRERNRVSRGAARTALSLARTSINSGKETTEADVNAAIRALDIAAQKGVFHKNTAARLKSRLMAKYHSSKKDSK